MNRPLFGFRPNLQNERHRRAWEILQAVPDGQEQRPIGIWGQQHLRYIKEYRKPLYMELLTSGRMNAYLAELNEEAETMLFRLVKQLAEKEGVTESLKAEDGLKWTQAMNNIRNRAAEVVYNDLIYN